MYYLLELNSLKFNMKVVLCGRQPALPFKKPDINYNFLPKDFRGRIKITRVFLNKGINALRKHSQNIVCYARQMHIRSRNK